MKIYPVKPFRQNSFCAKIPSAAKPDSKARDFAEAALVTSLTTLPMFFFLALHNFIRKLFPKKQEKI